MHESVLLHPHPREGILAYIWRRRRGCCRRLDGCDSRLLWGFLRLLYYRFWLLVDHRHCEDGRGYLFRIFVDAIVAVHEHLLLAAQDSLSSAACSTAGDGDVVGYCFGQTSIAFARG